MPKSIQRSQFIEGSTTALGFGIPRNITYYLPIVGGCDLGYSTTNPNHVAFTPPFAGTLRNLTLYVNSSTLIVGTTCSIMVAGVTSSTQTLTIAATSAAGVYTSAGADQAFSAGEAINLTVLTSNGGIGKYTNISGASCELETSTDQWEMYFMAPAGGNLVSTSTGLSPAVTTASYVIPPRGGITRLSYPLLSVYRATAQHKVRAAGTAEALFAYVNTAQGTGTSPALDVYLEVGNTTSSLHLAIPAGSTSGRYVTTGVTTSLADGDLICYSYVISGGSGTGQSTKLVNLGMSVKHPTNSYDMGTGNNYIGYQFLTPSNPFYTPFVGNNKYYANTAAPVETIFPYNVTLSNLRVNCGALNLGGATHTVTVHPVIDGVTGSQSVIIPHNTAGWYEDTTSAPDTILANQFLTFAGTYTGDLGGYINHYGFTINDLITTKALITQVNTEILTYMGGSAYLTQVMRELLEQGAALGRITKSNTEILSTLASLGYITKSNAEILSKMAGNGQLTKMDIEILAKLAGSGYLTQTFIEILASTNSSEDTISTNPTNIFTTM